VQYFYSKYFAILVVLSLGNWQNLPLQYYYNRVIICLYVFRPAKLQ